MQKIKLDATLGGVTVWKGSLTDWKQLPEATEAEVAYKLKVWAVINKTRKNFHLGNQQPRASGVGLEAKPESVERMERKKRQPAQAPARSSAPKRRATGTTTMKRRVTDEVAKIIGMPPEAACNYVDRVHGNPKVAEILAGSKTVVSACEKRLLVTIVDGAVKWSEVRDERGGRSVLCAQEAIGQSKALANILALGRQGCDDPIGVEAAQGMLRVSSRLQKEATKLLDGVYNNATKEIALGLLRKRRGRKTRPEDVQAVVDYLNESWLMEIPGRTKRVKEEGGGSKRVGMCSQTRRWCGARVRSVRHACGGGAVGGELPRRDGAEALGEGHGAGEQGGVNVYTP